MRLPSALPLALLAALAACGTPQEQCIRSATREIATVDRLIAEAQGNLARGYSYETREVTRWEWERCDDWVPGTPPRMCWEPVTDWVRKPVAIDPAAEKRKLAALKERRAVLARQAETSVAACKRQYPE